MRPELILEGVIPANLMLFDSDLRIDEKNLRRHLSYLADTPGVAGIATNGHASEVASLTLEEQRRCLDIALDEVSGKVPVVCGVYEDGTYKAAEIARSAEKQGADCLLVFPSTVFDRGVRMRPEMAYNHYLAIAEATSLPMVIFNYPTVSGLHIPTETLVRICAEIDNVIAVKEYSNDIAVYERNHRELKSLDKEISVLTSFSTSLLASLCVGADGILSGHGSMIADLHVEIFEAVKCEDLAEARRVAERMYPIVQVIYAEPFRDSHTRMKEAIAILDRVDEAHVRHPLQRVPEADRERIRQVVTEAGLLIGSANVAAGRRA